AQIAEVQQRANGHRSRGERQGRGATTNDQRRRRPWQAFPSCTQERRCATDHRGERYHPAAVLRDNPGQVVKLYQRPSHLAEAHRLLLHLVSVRWLYLQECPLSG